MLRLLRGIIEPLFAGKEILKPEETVLIKEINIFLDQFKKSPEEKSRERTGYAPLDRVTVLLELKLVIFALMKLVQRLHNIV